LKESLIQAESKKLTPEALADLNRKRDKELQEINELNKITSEYNNTITELTRKRDMMNKNNQN